MLEDVYEDVGRRIRTARMEDRITQEQLAEKLDLSGPLVAQWENGSRRISLVDLKRVARVMSRPMAYFVGDDAPADIAEEIQMLAPRKRNILMEMIRVLHEPPSKVAALVSR